MKRHAATVVRRNFERIYGAALAAGANAVVYRFAPQFHALTSESSMMLTRGLTTAWSQYVEAEQLQYKHTLPERVLKFGRIVHLLHKPRKEPDRERSKYLAAFKSLQGGDGLAFPLFGLAGNDGFCLILFDHELSSDEVAKGPALSAELHQIHVDIVSELQGTFKDRVALSPRELTVLREIARGQSNKQIGQTMTITAATVDSYIRRLFVKLDVNDRIDATLKALSTGLLRL